MSTHELLQQFAKSTSRRLGKIAVLGAAVIAAVPTAQAIVNDYGSLTIASGGVLNINDNNVIVRTGSLATLTGHIKTGLYNGANGFWDGPGINSGTAANNPNQTTAVGILDNSLAGYTDWPPLEPVSGLTGTEILIKYTWFGDADLDGTVTIGDYLLIDAGFGTPGATDWVNGDFDYDGAVTVADYLLIDAAFGEFSAGGPPLSPSAGAPVPEPSIAALLGCAFIGLVGRRHRSKE